MMIVVLFGLISVGGFWWLQTGSLTAEEKLLFSSLDAAINSNPPLVDDVVEAFALPQACGRATCWLNGSAIGRLQYEQGDLSPSEEGFVFQLEGFSTACIRKESVMEYFNTEIPREECSHGGCWYTLAQYPWGVLAFGLNRPDSACISSVVINSLPYMRLSSSGS